MPNRDQPDDKLFKLALANPKDAALELRAVLPPALAANIDFQSLTPEPDTFLDDAIKGSYADLLYTVHYRDREALLYVLFEHGPRRNYDEQTKQNFCVVVRGNLEHQPLRPTTAP